MFLLLLIFTILKSNLTAELELVNASLSSTWKNRIAEHAIDNNLTTLAGTWKTPSPGTLVNDFKADLVG